MTGPSGYAYLEYFGVAEQQGSGHAGYLEAPSVYTDAVSVYVGEGFQKFNAFHLVFAFFDAGRRKVAFSNPVHGWHCRGCRG